MTSDERAFETAHRGLLSPEPILMSATNPTGWKLEELLLKLRGEIEVKNARLAEVKSEAGLLRSSAPSEAVVAANQQIMAKLFDAEGVQRGLLAGLDKLGPDQGPRGRPRIGHVGSSVAPRPDSRRS